MPEKLVLSEPIFNHICLRKSDVIKTDFFHFEPIKLAIFNDKFFMIILTTNKGVTR